jgi:hypothetical protein
VHPSLFSSTTGVMPVVPNDNAYATSHFGPPVLAWTSPASLGRGSSPGRDPEGFRSHPSSRSPWAQASPSGFRDGDRSPDGALRGGSALPVVVSGSPVSEVNQLKKLRSRSVDSGVVEPGQVLAHLQDGAGSGSRAEGLASLPPPESWVVVARSILSHSGAVSALTVEEGDEAPTPSPVPDVTRVEDDAAGAAAAAAGAAPESPTPWPSQAPNPLPPSPMLGTILLDLMHYYSREFNPYELGVSVLLGCVCVMCACS